ncbi:DUF6000 family protein [Streptacidiphilus sp. ASG 303]|uniref:DUF6000 family protein n=1 Tax=Streptacidiphilus sp. ASG 303 TaxID=2896847 RepID=UPI001E32DA8E|nr:DUF6000 family protein [Streptacidiphilus sp. ASG 303]MCD0482601.1 DUF6000 family protein [Streptacidiphilus sp. ASG 303]
MPYPHEDPSLLELVRRYVTPGRRYLRLGGSVLRMGAAEREAFARELAEATGGITADELQALLDGGWRERRTAAWLISVAGRREYRARLGALLLAGEDPYAGGAYCLALATFATAGDAELLCAYLDRFLPRLELSYDQGPAIGALLHIDTHLGTGRAEAYLGPGGLWERWTAGPPAKAHEPAAYQEAVGALCAFARESSGHLYGSGVQRPPLPRPTGHDSPSTRRPAQ